MKFNFTIKKMLTGLVGLGVIVILGLSAASFYSNNYLIKSQARLTQIVLPLEMANQKIRVAMAAFFERQRQIVGASSLKDLDKLAVRDYLEVAFDDSLKQLKKLSSERKKAEIKIQQLIKIYEDFLGKDKAIFEAVKSSLKIETQIDNMINTMDKVGENLQKNAEIVFDRVNFAAKKEKIGLLGYVNAPEKSEELQKAVKELLQGDLAKTQKACNNLRLGVASLAIYGRQILLFKDVKSIDQIEKGQITKAETLVEASLSILKKDLAESVEMMAFVKNIEDDFIKLKGVLADVAALKVSAIKKRDEMVSLQSILKKNIASINENLDSLQTIALEIRKNAEIEAGRVRKLTGWIIGIAGLISILAMIIIGRLIIKRIIVPIEMAVSFTDAISKGDLTAEIQLDKNGAFSGFGMNMNDEMGKLVSKLGNMVKSLNSLISQVQQSGVQVTSSATELAATSKQQEAIMSNQVESTKYVIKSIGEIKDASAELVNTMQQVTTLSEKTADIANKGQADLSGMEEAIGHMEDASRSISGKLEAINEKAANITTVVTTITKVADQTNLLSLNAAIEAEKAGEYGRGFTVVAREIRRLADQTAVATLDIDHMVQDMQSAVSAGVMEMDVFIKEVQRSARDVGRISVQLSKIIEQVQALNPNFETVNESMKFQSDRAQQINTAMMNLGEEMEQTMESLRESFLAIEQLNNAVRGLQDEVSRFKVKK